jgi:Putative prokaryotic signal transducing protein
MVCPECGGEYRDGFFECADCGVPLVEQAPAVEEPAVSELVTVLETADPAEIAFVESLFLEEGIPYFKRGESIQDLFALGRIGVNAVTGPVQIQVPQEHADAATQLLADVSAEVDADSLAESE